MSEPNNIRIAILASGKGSNLRRIAEACSLGEIPAKITLVFSDKEDAGALSIAAEFGIEAQTMSAADFVSRADFDDAVAELLDSAAVDLVVFAGYMRLVSDEFIERFRNRILNVHPSLLPAFPGAHAVRDAMEYGVKIVGVTVHFVTEEMDSGPIILQDVIRVNDGESLADLMNRVHQLEHSLYPEAIKLYAEGRLRIEGRVVRVLGHSV